MQAGAMMRRCAPALTFALLLLVVISKSHALADATREAVNCSALCQILAEAPPAVSACERVCDAVEAQANEPCGRDLLTSSPEHLSLLSYSSGHVAETAAILLGVANASAEAVAFLSDLHLYDRGSPEACAALQDTHYCLGQGVVLPVAVGLCLPRSCESIVVSNFFANITASSSSNNDDDSSGALDIGTEITFFCGDEGSLSVDAGTIAMFVVIGSLAVLITVGTALEHVRLGRREKYLRTKGGQTGNGTVHGHDGGAPGHEEDGNTSREEAGYQEGNKHVGGGEGGDDEFVAYGIRDEDPGREPLLAHRSSSTQVGVPSVGTTATKLVWWCECLECFSLRRNAEKLLAPPRAGNEFGALDGVRTLSMLWVLLGHVLVYSIQGPGFTNMIDVFSVLSRWVGAWIPTRGSDVVGGNMFNFGSVRAICPARDQKHRKQPPNPKPTAIVCIYGVEVRTCDLWN